MRACVTKAQNLALAGGGNPTMPFITQEWYRNLMERQGHEAHAPS